MKRNGYVKPGPPSYQPKTAGKCRRCGRRGWRRHVCKAVLALLLGFASAAFAETLTLRPTPVPRRVVAFVQPQGKSAVLYQRTNDNWRLWFTLGRTATPGGEAQVHDVTNAAVKEVRVLLQ